MSAPLNRAGSDFPDDIDREDFGPDPGQFPRFRGPPPRLRPPQAPAQPSPPVSPAAADQDKSPIVPAATELIPAPTLILQPREIEAAKERVKALMERMERRTLEDALEIGREALRVNRALAHGEVGRWLKDAFGERRARTIYNWIGMVEYSEAHPVEFATFSILNVSAVYLLTAPKTPREAVEKIVRRIGAGTIPSLRTVRAEIALAKKQDAPTGKMLAATTRCAVPEVRRVPLAGQVIAPQGGSAQTPWDECRAMGLAALHAVAQLIPPDDRNRAIVLLREAAETHCGLHDLMRVLYDASGQPDGDLATWG